MKQFLALSLGAVLLAASFAHPAIAATKAAQWLMAEQAKEGCNGNPGRFASGVIERDLNGDGRLDLILHHSGLVCEPGVIGSRSGFCGMQACSALIYVRRGPLLKLETEILAVTITVGDETPPVIRFTKHGGDSEAIRWDGATFR